VSGGDHQRIRTGITTPDLAEALGDRHALADVLDQIITQREAQHHLAHRRLLGTSRADRPDDLGVDRVPRQQAGETHVQMLGQPGAVLMVLDTPTGLQDALARMSVMAELLLVGDPPQRSLPVGGDALRRPTRSRQASQQMIPRANSPRTLIITASMI
jgi:Trp operon repressor